MYISLEGPFQSGGGERVLKKKKTYSFFFIFFLNKEMLQRVEKWSFIFSTLIRKTKKKKRSFCFSSFLPIHVEIREEESPFSGDLFGRVSVALTSARAPPSASLAFSSPPSLPTCRTHTLKKKKILPECIKKKNANSTRHMSIDLWLCPLAFFFYFTSVALL